MYNLLRTNPRECARRWMEPVKPSDKSIGLVYRFVYLSVCLGGQSLAYRNESGTVCARV